MALPERRKDSGSKGGPRDSFPWDEDLGGWLRDEVAGVRTGPSEQPDGRRSLNYLVHGRVQRRGVSSGMGPRLGGPVLVPYWLYSMQRRR